MAEETNSHLATVSFQAVVESEEVPPEPPFFQTKDDPLILLLRDLTYPF